MTAYAFVVPDMHAAFTGGNVYNLGLTSALREIGVEVRVVDRHGERPHGLCFVDTLYLDDVPRFVPCHVIAHYLPSLVEDRAPSEAERRALAAADGFVVPSAFMRDVLFRIAPKACVVVPPGIEVDHTPVARAARAVIVANLVPGKGVLPFLRALGDAPLELAVIGAPHDRAYAQACRAAGPRVDFLGPLEHEKAMAEIAASDFLVSASRMESYGLVLAEARALGVPIFARSGGNAGAHVEADAGGALFDSDDALARACIELAGDRAEIERRRTAAQAHRPLPRSWTDAARELVAAFTD